MIPDTTPAVGRELRLPTYGVTIASGALARLGELARAAAPAHRYAVISDETVAALYGPRATHALGSGAELFTIPAGEAYKTRDTWNALTDAMLAAGFGRDTTVVALGGGVVGDVAGFVAATYMRGVPVVQVPTTLLAMVDASVGGKVGVDTDAGKNLVGAFHPPAAVVIDPDVLRTLPDEHRRGGLAEVLKHGVIADECYFEQVESQLPLLLSSGPAAEAALGGVIARSVEIKAGVVARDEREGGIRKTLNFGHTIAHALEHLSGYTLLHGSAVGIGMIAESELGERLGVTEPGTTARIRRAVQAAGLPVSASAGSTAAAIVAATRSDKKARGGAVEYALPHRVGAMAGENSNWGIAAPGAYVVTALASIAPQDEGR